MGLTLTKTWSRVTAGDLEYIPDRPDFIDGDPVVTDDHPTNEIHTGELPSEQDPRDKVEEGDGDYSDCPDSVEVIMPVELGDMTDIIEGWVKSAKRGEASSRSAQNWWSMPWTQKGKAYNTQRQVKKDQRKTQESQRQQDEVTQYILGYNLFNDDKVVSFLRQEGLSPQEIQGYANLRERDLVKANENYAKTGKPLQWGEGLGRQWRPMTQEERQWHRSRQTQQPQSVPPAQQQPQQPQQPLKQRIKRSPYPMTQQQSPQPPKQRIKRSPYPVSSALSNLRHQVNLVGGLLAMPRTADVIRQTVDLVSAVHELDDGQSLDETTRSALRNTSRNLLAATNHLKSVNNRIANRVAGEIEQLFVDSLSN